MAKVKIQGNASGTGVLTVTAPNTSTDRTITLPDSTGTLLTADGDGSSLTGVGVAGISSSADATAMTITSAEQIGIGTGSPSGTLHINSTANTNATTTYITRGDGTNNLPASIDTQTSLMLANSSDTYSNYLSIQSAPVGTSGINFGDSADENIGQIGYFNNGDTMRFKVGATEKMRLTSDGLTFNGDTAAANALSDYEEGTWTPVFKDSSNATIQGSLYGATYTKVGNIVCATVYYNVSDLQNGNLNSITLPFSGRTSGGNNRQGGTVLSYGCPIPSNQQHATFIGDGASTASFWRLRDDATSVTYMSVDNGSELIFSWTYQTD